MNSNELGGFAANQYVLTSDSRLSDARAPTGGSTNYIQNSPLLQQPASFNINGNGIIGGNLTVNGLLTANLPSGDNSYIQNRTSQQIGIVNFNILGSGTVGGTLSASTVSATAQYNLTGNNRILGIGPSDSLFVGLGAGANNDTGNHNSFFGRNAGNANTAGLRNSFFGNDAGLNNDGGNFNSFFGDTSGASNRNGVENSFFGNWAGSSNIGGDDNSFFGFSAGLSNTSGNSNSFFGERAGESNLGGDDNSFFGQNAGSRNTNGYQNAFFGERAGVSNTNGESNAFFGSAAGLLGKTGFRNSYFGGSAGSSNHSGNYNTMIGYGADMPPASDLSYATAIGAQATVSSSNTIVLGRSNNSDTVVVPGKLQIDTLGTTGSDHLCINSSNRVAACSSSLRYKTHLAPYRNGLEILNRLRPITFTWKDGGMRDVGFGAEDVEKIEPLLVTYNKQGQVEGVKYDRINVVLVNAIREQQEQIASFQDEIKRQQQVNEQIKQQLSQIEALKKVVCAANPTAELCHK